MSRARTFTKAELLDAARAAAETGLSARLHPSGEIEFTHDTRKRNMPPSRPEDALEGWINGSKASGRA